MPLKTNSLKNWLNNHQAEGQALDLKKEAEGLTSYLDLYIEKNKKRDFFRQQKTTSKRCIMKYNKSLFTYFLSVFFFVPLFSIADVLVEPYGGVGGAFAPSANKKAGSFFMKYTAGGHLGYQISLIKVGLDLFWTHYDTGRSQGVVTVRPSTQDTRGFTQATKSVGIKSTDEHTAFQPLSIGVWTAVDLPLFFDVYGSLFYAFGKKDSIHHQGYGLKAGVSWSIAPHLQLNLDAKWAYYKCQPAKCVSQFSVLSALLSLSVPFSLDLFSSTPSAEIAKEEDSNDDEEEAESLEDSSSETV